MHQVPQQSVLRPGPDPKARIMVQSSPGLELANQLQNWCGQEQPRRKLDTQSEGQEFRGLQNPSYTSHQTPLPPAFLTACDAGHSWPLEVILQPPGGSVAVHLLQRRREALRDQLPVGLGDTHTRPNTNSNPRPGPLCLLGHFRDSAFPMHKCAEGAGLAPHSASLLSSPPPMFEGFFSTFGSTGDGGQAHGHTQQASYQPLQ